jgi:hypothetical protein
MAGERRPLPRLTSVEFREDFDLDFEFQFVPTSFNVNTGANYAEATTLNRQHPILQWANGRQKTINFEAKLWAHDVGQNIDLRVKQLESTTVRVASLGRPPIFVFTWGREINEFVVVESVGNVTIDELREDGSYRGALFRLTLKKYTFFDLEVTDPSEPESSTFYRTVKDGDLWESLAQREYRDALKGDLIRRLNPGKPFLDPGDVVALLDRGKVRGVSVQPEAPPLARTPEAIEMREEIFELRNESKTTHIGTVGG